MVMVVYTLLKAKNHLNLDTNLAMIVVGDIDVNQFFTEEKRV